jgi:uncharacterized protein
MRRTIATEADDGAGELSIGLAVLNAGDEKGQPNYPDALDWFRKAALKGNTEAQFNLGAMCYFGHGVAQNYPDALDWFRKAAFKGHAKAQFNLGVMYDVGQGVPQDHA